MATAVRPSFISPLRAVFFLRALTKTAEIKYNVILK